MTFKIEFESFRLRLLEKSHICIHVLHQKKFCSYASKINFCLIYLECSFYQYSFFKSLLLEKVMLIIRQKNLYPCKI